nr:MAG TPA: hypothetical protein [Caudoviricetes sp.]
MLRFDTLLFTKKAIIFFTELKRSKEKLKNINAYFR